ncbi:MAG: FAD-dependent 5-carboxymethylaminomethyl-2-thiouridine(34) oxidoreductase MnmC, partial [Parvularculaceae bacterium]
ARVSSLEALSTTSTVSSTPGAAASNPSKNPSRWRPEVAAELARLSAPGATAATFTVAGDVRRTFEAAGFVVAKRAGYGRKREMLAARLSRQPQRSRRAPWFESDQRPLRRGAEVAVIGAGIAGASLACALSRVGLSPTLIDPLGIAGGASGNPAGLIMPRLDLGGTPAARFFRSAHVQAVAAIDRLDTDGARFFNRCGALLKATSADGRLKQEKIAAAGLLPTDWMELRPDGLFFPQAGVIDPAEFCRQLAAGAELVRARALTTQDDGDGVAVRFGDGARRSFDAVILANGREALRFFEARTLPLRGVMGQIDHFPDAETSPHAIAFGPYCAPAPAGGLIIGATNEAIAPGADAFVQASATRANIEALRAGAPEIADRLSAEYSRPRAAIRCQTLDRLPVVGPLPDWDAYGALYDDLRTGTRRDYAAGPMAHRRYILSGLGSRGLVTAPLLAAILAAELTGAPSPVARDVAQALHPARFFIRDLRRARMKGSKPDLAEGSTRG